MKITIDLPIEQLDNIQYWLGAQEPSDTFNTIHIYGLDFTQEQVDELDKALLSLYKQIRAQVIDELINSDGRIIKK